MSVIFHVYKQRRANWFGESHITLLESQLPGVCVSLLLLEVLLLVRHKRLWRVRLMLHGQLS